MDIRKSTEDYYKMLTTDVEAATRKFYSDDVKYKLNWDRSKKGFDVELEGLETLLSVLNEFKKGLKSQKHQKVLDVTVDEDKNSSRVEISERYSHEQWGDVDHKVLVTLYWRDGKVVEEQFEAGH